MINARLQRLSSHGCNPKDEIDRFILMFNGRFEARKTLNSERKFDYDYHNDSFQDISINSKETLKLGNSDIIDKIMEQEKKNIIRFNK